jgi:ATP-dependent DNA helicase RecQ
MIDMPSFCAGYFTGDILFDVDGLSSAPAPVPSFVANTFAVLTRGAPTQPSPALLSLILPDQNNEDIDWGDFLSQPLDLISDKTPTWDNTIRGGDQDNNPALNFFVELLPSELPKLKYLQSLLVPEYPLFEKLKGPKALVQNANDERVDFYLPQANLVIEIDGVQHLKEHQKSKDEARDRFLERFGIATLRLTTDDIRNRDEKFKIFFKKLSDHCNASSILCRYQAALHQNSFSASSLKLELTACIRLQIAIIAALSHRQLSLDEQCWRLSIKQDFKSGVSSDWARAAVEEVFVWFGLFARIKNLDFQPPEILFADDGLIFDIRLFERPDERCLPVGSIVVRTSSVQTFPYISETAQTSEIVQLKYFGVSRLASFDPSGSLFNKPSRQDLLDLTYQLFGHKEFRPGQEKLILNALSGNNSLGLMPTGSGKSLCFKVPALIHGGTTVTIVPIKALGRDHCAELDAAGFSGRSINIDSDLPKTFLRDVVAPLVSDGAIRFVFVSPERFQTDAFLSLIESIQATGLLRMFVIDEVHCLSEWGHDFRPAYLTLPGTLQKIGSAIPVLGLTATASVNVLQDIQSEFKIPDHLVSYEMHQSRTELNFSIQKSLGNYSQVFSKVEELLEKEADKVVEPIHVFARYVNGSHGVEDISKRIAASKMGLRVGSFSGSQPKEFEFQETVTRFRSFSEPEQKNFEGCKQLAQKLWKAGELDVIVTTKAFGMGVNKSDVRHTLHAGMPSSMEAFYQEAGRAGRDGEDAFCHMLFRPEPDDAAQIFEELREDLTPSTINKFLTYDTTGKKLGKWSGGDFRAQLWFLSNGLIESQVEIDLVVRALDHLLNNEQSQVLLEARYFSSIEGGYERLQRTLYRIYQMGLITPWKVVDWGRPNQPIQSCMVQKRDVSFHDACRSVIKRIRAIDGKATVVTQIEELIDYPDGKLGWRLLISYLVEWSRRKHLDSRLQSTWNLYSKSAGFETLKAGEFRNELEAFFKVDNNSFELSTLRDLLLPEAAHGIETLIINAVHDGDDGINKLRFLVVQLERLLEGTQNSDGLNLSASMLLLLTDQEAHREAETRFNSAVSEGVLEFWKGCGRSLINLVASTDAEACDTLGEWLLRCNPDRDTMVELFEDIPADSIGRVLFDELSSEINKAI